MIGKMYRPIKILSLKDKRGYQFLHKYKSNFGGIVEFTQDIHLYYHSEDQSETIRMDFQKMMAPLLLDSNQFYKESEQSCISRQEKFILKELTLRKLEKPGIKIPEKWESFFEKWKKKEVVRDRKGNIVGEAIKADLFSRGESLYFEMPIFSKREEENEWVVVEMKPVVWNGKEFITINVRSQTPVEITTDSYIHLF